MEYNLPATIIISLAVVVLLIIFIYKKSKKPLAKPEVVEPEKKVEINIDDLPENLREQYKIATDPTGQNLPVLYALVTCQHCIRTQKFLKENQIAFKLIHVDLFSGDIRKEIMRVLKEFNEKGSFPTFIMPSGKTVVGFREHLLREAIKNEPERTS